MIRLCFIWDLQEGDDVAADDSLSRRSSSATLLSVLDDKNKAIEVLQRQLHNQKLQLGYYIKNALKPSKIIQLSKTVSTLLFLATLYEFTRIGMHCTNNMSNIQTFCDELLRNEYFSANWANFNCVLSRSSSNCKEYKSNFCFIL